MRLFYKISVSNGSKLGFKELMLAAFGLASPLCIIQCHLGLPEGCVKYYKPHRGWDRDPGFTRAVGDKAIAKAEEELASPVVLMFFCPLNSLLGEKQSTEVMLMETGVIPGMNPSEHFLMWVNLSCAALPLTEKQLWL